MQTSSVVLNIGADIGKDKIVVACAEESFLPHKIANRRAELAAWLKSVPAGSRINMESTSSYHELLAGLAHQAGFVVYVLNPKDTRHYAKAMGLRGKTDRVDAKLIARLIAREHEKLRPWIMPTPEQRQIDRMIKRRAKVSGIRAALGQSLSGLKGFAAELKALNSDWTSSLPASTRKSRPSSRPMPSASRITRAYAESPVWAPSSEAAWSARLSACLSKTAMPSSPSPALTRCPTSPDTTSAGGVYRSAARPNCADCSTWPPWRRPKRRSGNRSTSTIAPRASRVPRCSSYSRVASRVLPGRSIPTRQNSIHNDSWRG